MTSHQILVLLLIVIAAVSRSRHRLREDVAVRANSVLGGLHHEYFLAPRAASLSICG
jgi:hypothetical protein